MANQSGASDGGIVDVAPVGDTASALWVFLDAGGTKVGA